MPITIQEIIASDTISQLVDKTNFNFDQLLLNGGGPAGPAGPIGPVGPAGGRGPKGTTWYEDTSTSAPGVTPIAVPPTSTPLGGDYYLQFNGVVWEYTGLTWSQTTIDLEGPMGPQGPGGGMGDLFGGPISINQETAIYNGPIGSGQGATTTNEGIPTVMIGGAVTTTTALTGIPLTNAYIIPNEIAIGAQSNNVSLLIHQKDSGGKAIVFQGGGAIPGEKYWQGQPGINSEMTNLSNIKIGQDDRLILDVPKVATTPTTPDDLIGIQLNTPAKSQSFTAGKAIGFQTGQRTTQDFSGENSDFTINVGVGSAPGGNKFSLTTAGTAGSTLMELGAGFPVVLQQTAQVGVAQIRAGLIQLTSSTNQNIQLYSGGQLKLNTRTGSNPAGTISLNSGSGGISLDTNSTGNINIQQSNSSNSNTGNIVIENLSQAPNSVVGGDIYIQGNSQIILKKTTQTALNNCSIVIDYGRFNPTSGTPQPHTRFVGPQTIAGFIASYPPQSFQTLIYKDPTGYASGSTNIYELTGNNGVTDYSPGAMLQAWTGGTQTATGLDAGLLAIAMGSEGPQSPVAPINFMWDNTLGFSVRDSGNNNEYFTASKNKIAFSSPWVLKRATGRNSSINNNPDLSYSPGSTQSAPMNYGWNSRQIATPQGLTPSGQYPSLGMPTTEELTVPYISLNFGPGLGFTADPSIQPSPAFNNVNLDYDYKVSFPIGGYPGQRLLLKVYVQSLSYLQNTKAPGSPVVTISNYGSVDLRIPMFRIKSPTSTGNWTSWWGSASSSGSSAQVIDGYQVITVSTSSADAGDGIGRYKMIDMFWDGKYVTQQGAEVNFADANAFSTQVQHGWAVMSSSIGSMNSNRIAISGYDNSPGCFVAGTEIALANGDTKNIEDIISGEELITWNESKQTTEVGTVGGLDVIENVGMVIVLDFDNGSTLKVTEHHPFYHIDGENVGLIDAAELREGFEVYQLNGEKAKVVSTKEEQGLYTVYNITNVSGNHNYYTNEILVHNKGGN